MTAARLGSLPHRACSGARAVDLAGLGDLSVLGGNRADGPRRLRPVRVTRLRRATVAPFVVAAAGLLASCGVAHAGAASSGRPWYSTWSGGCGPPAVVRVDGHVMGVGNCAGMLVVPAQQVTLDVGQRIDVHVTEEGTGPHGNKRVPAIPLPASSRPSVLIRSTVSPDRATATYRAVGSGDAVLTSSRAFCLHVRHHRDRETTGSCPAIEITVVP